MNNLIKFTNTDKDNLTGTTDTAIILGANKNIVADGDGNVYAITDDLRVCKYVNGVLSNCCGILPIIQQKLTFTFDTTSNDYGESYISLPPEIFVDLSGETDVTILSKCSNSCEGAIIERYIYRFQDIGINTTDIYMGRYDSMDSNNECCERLLVIDRHFYDYSIPNPGIYPNIIKRDSSGYTLYFSGASNPYKINSSIGAFPALLISSTLKIGTMFIDEYYDDVDGTKFSISDFAIVKGSLTSQQIDDYYNNLLDVSTLPNLHCHYKLNEGTGTVVEDSTGNYGDGNIVVTGGISYAWSNI